MFDNLGLWAIFTIGFSAGALVAACAFLPIWAKGWQAGYKEGAKR